PPPPIGRIIAASTAGRAGRDVAEMGNRLFLIVSQPARFAEETLGTLTVGYALDDAVAQQLAQVTHSEVSIVLGQQLAATSLAGERRAALASLIAMEGTLPIEQPRRYRLADGDYIAAAYPLSPNGEGVGAGRLVLLQDWAPTNRDLAQLRRQLAGAGVLIFGV